jgi:excisionase family DNA binding protein
MRHESRSKERVKARQQSRMRQRGNARTKLATPRPRPRTARPPAAPLTHHQQVGKRRNDGSRHTTNPPVRCLGRSSDAGRFAGGSSRPGRPPTAPSGGRLWHGSAVRRPLLGGGGEAPTFGLVLTYRKHLGAHPIHSALPLDIRGMERKSRAFFTERTLAAHLAVSDRTIRNWIRRGELPSYKLGASRRIDPADVEDFLSRHRDEAA